MKRVSYILLIALTLGFSACDNFLSEDNRANNPANEYYATAVGYDALVNYSYSFLRDIYGENAPRLFCAGTDLYMLNCGSDAAVTEGIGNYENLAPNNADVTDFYDRCYAAIGACNTALYYADKTEDTGTTLQRQIAEVRFLRAHFYFLLVQHFGGVALVTEMAQSPVMEVPRASAETIYNFVITELSDLLNSALPAGAISATGNNGRVDKRVVQYYLALAYLSRGYESFRSTEQAQEDFTHAKTYAVEAINGQPFTLTFEQSYQAKDKGYRNNEIIFSIAYSLENAPATEAGNRKMALFSGCFGGTDENHKAVEKRNTFAGTLFAHYVFSKDIQDPNNDVRHELTFMREVYNSYMDFYTKTEEELQKTKIFGLYVPWWLSDDMDAWVANWKTQGTPEQDRANTRIRVYPDPGNPDTDLATFQAWSGTNSSIPPGGPNDYGWAAYRSANFNYPLCRKFDDPNPPVFDYDGSRRDIDLVRLSDLYFVAAEASIQLNSGDAHTFINPIRERSIDPSDAQRTISASEATIDFLLDEKARESYGDFNRWMDLKRTGKLIERTSKYNPDVNFSASSFRGPDGNNKILRPIPQSAIDANRAQITQNPGY